MSRRQAARQKALSGLLTALLAGCGAAPQSCAPSSSQGHTGASQDLLAVTVFCGPDPADPTAPIQLQALVQMGATATYGPCRTPLPSYTVNEPGPRYASPAEYLTLAALAREAGIGLVAYDARFWGDAAARSAAARDWAPFIASGTLVALDLGDEPNYVDMGEMNRRAVLARQSGVEPTTVFVGNGIVGQTLAESNRRVPLDCPGTDRYEDIELAVAEARELARLAGCSVIAIDVTGRDLDGDGDGLNLDLIHRMRAEGQRILLFGGSEIPVFPDWADLVDSHGLTSEGRKVMGTL